MDYINRASNLSGLKSKTFSDKTEFLYFLNSKLNSYLDCICVSMPRRFGKTSLASMVNAYYCKGIDSKEQFKGLKIEKDPSFTEHLNKYYTLFINPDRRN